MIIDGLTITVIGMAIVFCFLIILVAAMKSLNFTLRKVFPKSLIAAPPGDAQAPAVETGKDTQLAVVAAAVASVKAHIAADRG